jgi:hypothetical protein
MVMEENKMMMYCYDSWIHKYWENPENKRYYSAIISQDLFGEWILERHWGGNKKRGRKVELPCSSYEEATKQLTRLQKIRKRHGYQETVRL